MENITYIDITEFDIVTTYAVIDRGNGEFTTMPKSTYEAQQVEHLTEIVTDEAKAK